MKPSKKLTTTLLTVAGLLGVALTDQELALYSLIAAAACTVAYVIAQAYVDAVGADNTNVDEVLAAIEKALAQVEGDDDGQG
jgi:hypothetical protein